MIQNQFEHLFGEIHTRSIGDTLNAERHGISSGWNHEFSMIRKFTPSFTPSSLPVLVPVPDLPQSHFITTKTPDCLVLIG